MTFYIRVPFFQWTPPSIEMPRSAPDGEECVGWVRVDWCG